MREIECRGKNDENRWVYGYYVRIEYPDGTFEHRIYTGETRGYGDEYTLPYIIYHYISPKTLGQYTTIKDKDDDKIYEGDIVMTENGNIGLIISVDGAFVVKYRDGTEDALYWTAGKGLRIVGNKFDNPELLEESNGI